MNYRPEQISENEVLSPEDKLELDQIPNTPAETLEFLATDENTDIRCGVAQHTRTPIEVLMDLPPFFLNINDTH